MLEIERPNKDERLRFVAAEMEAGVRFDPKMTQERFAEIAQAVAGTDKSADEEGGSNRAGVVIFNGQRP